MKILNKYTKAELISKFKNTETKNNKSKITFVETVISIKHWLMTFTLIALILNYYKKYALINKFVRWFNWIILGVFGVSLMDNIDFFNVFKEFKLILTGLASYLWSLTGWFQLTKEAEITKGTRPTSGVHSKGSWNEPKVGESEGNSKIIKWLKLEPEPEESSNKKYYIIAGIIIICFLGWYFQDEIAPVTYPIFQWFRSFRPGPDDNSSNIGSNVQQNNTMNLKSRIKNLFFKENSTSIKETANNAKGEVENSVILEDKTAIASSSKVANIATSKSSSDDSINAYLPIDENKGVDRQNVIPHYSGLSETYRDKEIVIPHYTGLSEIYRENFDQSAHSIFNEIDYFTRKINDPSFANIALKMGLYKLTLNRLKRLKQADEFAYDNLLDNQYIRNKIDNFKDLSKQAWFADRNYDEVAQATTQEQEIWSNSSPSPKVLSPLQENISQVISPMEEDLNAMSTYAVEDQQLYDYKKELSPKVLIDNEKYQEAVFESNKITTEDQSIAGPSTISQLIENEPKLDDSKLLEAIKGKLPEINIDSGSDKSMEAYFPEPKISEEDVKSRFANLWDKIGKNKKDSPVTGSPNISQVGLQPTKLSPLLNTSNQFEETMNLFDDDDISTVEELPSIINKGKSKEEFIEKIKPDYELRRKASKDIEISSNLSPTVDWNSANAQLSENNNERLVRIYFGDTWRNADEIIIRTNDNYIAKINFDPSMVPDWNSEQPKITTLDWGHQFDKLDRLGYKTEIHDIQIKDINGNLHEIYKNDNVVHK